MFTIIIHTTDLKPDVSKADIVIPVAKEEDLYKKIVQLAAEIQTRIQCISPGCYNDLRIMCSCSSEGLHLGSVVNAQNISEIFAPLKYKVGNITLYGSDGATNYYRANSGTLMCSKLAKATYANVRASLSHVNSSSRTNILTWNQRGKIIMLEHYENSELVATYDHPGELLIHELKRSHKKTNSSEKQSSPGNLFLNKLLPFFRKAYFSMQHARFFKLSIIRVKVNNIFPKK